MKTDNNMDHDPTTTTTTRSRRSSSSSKNTTNKTSSSPPHQQQQRTRDTVIVKPILYGNIAHHLGKKADPTKTHKWTCYIRGLNAQEDLSFIRKVVFTLHESFANPVREVLQPPWEVSEQGWGEFDIRIQIYFQDQSEKPVVVDHLLTLFPKIQVNAASAAAAAASSSSSSTTNTGGATSAASNAIDGGASSIGIGSASASATGGPIMANLAPKKILVTEHYEELLFVNPKPQFYEQLMACYTTAPAIDTTTATTATTTNSATTDAIAQANMQGSAKKKRKKGTFALSNQSQVEIYAPKMDEKKDVDLLTRTCKALDLKINELNAELAKKMEQQQNALRS